MADFGFKASQTSPVWRNCDDSFYPHRLAGSSIYLLESRAWIGAAVSAAAYLVVVISVVDMAVFDLFRRSFTYVTNGDIKVQCHAC